MAYAIAEKWNNCSFERDKDLTDFKLSYIHYLIEKRNGSFVAKIPFLV
jgi:hypothetical protein